MKRWAAILLAAALAAMAVGAVAESGSVWTSTPLNASPPSKVRNIELAVRAIDGATLRSGDSFSFNGIVGPRTAERGYRTARNGRGANVIGGGVAQVATTIYLALLQLDGIAYDELRTYNERFADDYVSSGYRAVITDYDAGTDFRFTSYRSDELTITLWLDTDSVNCLISLSRGEGDLVGYSSIPVYGTYAKANNIALASDSIFGATLYRFDEFSFNGIVGPRTAERGYEKAVNGRGVSVVGGGVAQVASAVYLAVKRLDSVSITRKSTYGNRFTEWYVADPDDAIATDYNTGLDFAFRYEGYGALTIYAYISGDELICEVYERYY